MASGQLCVLCRRRPAEDRWRPFCSERCKLLDLARWVDGQYRVPAESLAQDEAETSEDEAGKP